METGRAAAATWIFRGDKSRRRRGCDVDSLWRRVDDVAAASTRPAPRYIEDYTFLKVDACGHCLTSPTHCFQYQDVIDAVVGQIQKAE